MANNIKFTDFKWINPPDKFSLETDRLTLITDPETDFWQRTHYGFQNDNGHAFLMDKEGDFTFVVKTTYEAKNQYDQCGVLLYQDADNWVKASVEYENQHYARLGSVVTNLGYSDWASTDVSSEIQTMWYRLSRNGSDFCMENSLDGEIFQQMRIFHLHQPIQVVRVGVYACSPLESSFKAEFSDFKIGPCLWINH